MKKTITISILIAALFQGIVIPCSAQNNDCTQCEGGTVTGTNASTIGKNNTASGNNAFAGGYNTTASGSNSFAFGYNSTASQSTNIAIGNTAQATGIGAFAIGTYVKASAQNAYAIGSGTTTSYPLTNNTPNSIAFGTNSKKPTMLITKALNNNYTGKVAIGPITSPQAKLHIKADSNEDAGIIIEPSNKTTRKAFLCLFDSNHKLAVNPNGNMELNAGSGILNLSGNHYCFGGSGEVKTRIYTGTSTSIYCNVKRNKNTENRDVDAPSYAIDFNNDALRFRTATGQPLRDSEITNWKNALYLCTDGKIGIGSKNSYLENQGDLSLTLNSPGNIGLNAPQIGLNSTKITLNGKIGINTTNEVEDYALAVNGGIISTKVFIKEINHWPDYVFSEDYPLLSLEALKLYLNENRHLPGVPSEREITKEGYDLHEMQHSMMEKIEELTRYILILQDEIDSLKSTSNSHDRIVFTYDGNGNRITRSITFEKNENLETKPQLPQSLHCALFPNPTPGQFTVSMSITEAKSPVHAKLLTSSGVLMDERIIQENQSVFDLSAFADGIYILLLETTEGSESWKVVKQ